MLDTCILRLVLEGSLSKGLPSNSNLRACFSAGG